MSTASSQTDDDDRKRVDRELIELLNELRVALPGVQVLFAFLLAVPFQQRFGRVTSFERNVYFVTLWCTLVATALLIAPSALHRLNFRMADKRRIILLSNQLTILGIWTLALAMVGVMLLIGEFLFGGATGVVSAVIAAVIFSVFWAALPIHERLRSRIRRLDG
jgi:hypothetical protein